MRDFSRPDVLLKAAIAALIGTAACLPKLTQWTHRPSSIAVLAGMLGWCVFVMWAFVFAWGSRDGGTRPFQRPQGPDFWIHLSLAGILAAALLSAFVDAEYARLFPAEEPRSVQAWVAGLLFDLSLQQLFLCFAPLAFFARLGAGPRLTLGLTVALVWTVLTMKLQRSPSEPTWFAIPVFVAARGSMATAGVIVYRRAGVLAVWWFVLLLHTRHLPSILRGQ